jgi:hypothetical protein
MQETAQQYITRIHSYLGQNDPIVSLAATPARLRDIVRGAGADPLRKRPAPDRWSALEQIVHLADVEIVVGFRTRFILGAEDGVPVVAFDQDKWQTNMTYNARELEPTVKAFEVARDNNLRLYRSLSEAQWNKYGMHSERGKETVRQVVTMCAGHDINHLKQIEQLLGKAAMTA